MGYIYIFSFQYQRQLALQRIQEQEREMQIRQEQQKQQYLMGSQFATLPYMRQGIHVNKLNFLIYYY